MSKPLTKLDGAFELIRTSVDPGWWAVALLIAVMLGGFGWLSGQVSRMEAKVDAVSLKVAEMPGLFQRDLQAQTEKLSAHRQSVRAEPPVGGVAATQGGAPPPSHRSGNDGVHVVNNRPGPTAGAASNVNTTAAGPNSTAINATTAGPKQARAATAGRGSQAGPAASASSAATNPPPRTP